jgi:hypothetical protein
MAPIQPIQPQKAYDRPTPIIGLPARVPVGDPVLLDERTGYANIVVEANVDVPLRPVLIDGQIAMAVAGGDGTEIFHIQIEGLKSVKASVSTAGPIDDRVFPGRGWCNPFKRIRRIKRRVLDVVRNVVDEDIVSAIRRTAN